MAEILYDLYGTLIPPYSKNPPTPMIPRTHSQEEMGRFRREGHRVVLASSARVEDSHRILSACGLTLVVDEAFQTPKSAVLVDGDMEVRTKMYRDYLIGQRGFSPEQISAECFFTGDELGDLPGDIHNGVFLLDEGGYKRSATLHRMIFDVLVNGGSGNIFEGYKFLRRHSGRPFILPGFDLELQFRKWDFRNPHLGEMSVPVMSIKELS